MLGCSSSVIDASVRRFVGRRTGAQPSLVPGRR
jgi:hypothetical protein